MSERAHVSSLEHLQEFACELESFRLQLMTEIEVVQFELRRLSQWLENDVTHYWSEQTTLAERRLLERRQALSRCQSSVRADEQRPCTEEKKRVRRAEMRRELCGEKLRQVRGLSATWEAERDKLMARLLRCRDLAEADLATAMHNLRGHLERLQAYAGLRATPLSGSPRSEHVADSAPTTEPASIPLPNPNESDHETH